jgi:predicted transcriptional regulator
MTDILETVQHAVRKYLSEEINDALMPFIKEQVATLVSQRSDKINQIIATEVERQLYNNDRIRRIIGGYSSISAHSQNLIEQAVDKQAARISKLVDERLALVTDGHLRDLLNARIAKLIS